MEHTFTQIANGAALVMEFISVIMIVIGACAAIYKGFINRNTRPIKMAWITLAGWLLLGLEFTLAADVIRSAISPSWEQIGQLASIAVIRTFLNYFLERDLENILKTEVTEVSGPTSRAA